MTQVSKILGGRRESVAEAKLPLTQNITLIINFNNSWKKKKDGYVYYYLLSVTPVFRSLIWAKFIHCGIVLY